MAAVETMFNLMLSNTQIADHWVHSVEVTAAVSSPKWVKMCHRE